MSPRIILAALATAGAIGLAMPGFAAEGSAFVTPAETFVGRFVATSPACPAWDFHLTEAQNHALLGLAFDPMMSGKMSHLAGAVDASGKVHLTAEAMGGNGMTATIEGEMHGTTMVLTMTGGACPMQTVKLMPVQHIIADPTG